jgi:hypothetical protein
MPIYFNSQQATQRLTEVIPNAPLKDNPLVQKA